jgi:hypothetical protein
MILIRCMSTRNQFQMKSMKVIYKMKSILNKEFKHDEEWKDLIPFQNIEWLLCFMNPEWKLI